MQLSKDLVEKFQALHFKKYGMAIDYAAAESQLKELSKLVRLTSKREVQA